MSISMWEEWHNLRKSGASKDVLMDYVLSTYADLIEAVDTLEVKVERLEDQVYWLRQDVGEDA